MIFYYTYHREAGFVTEMLHTANYDNDRLHATRYTQQIMTTSFFFLLFLIDLTVYSSYRIIPYSSSKVPSSMSSWGTQISVGDQSRRSKMSFANDRYAHCCQCQSDQITKHTDVAGVRHNGDAYGTDIYRCEVCGWSTSYQWDDASEVYYYETMDYRNVDASVKPDPIPLSADIEQTFLRLLKMTKDRVLVLAGMKEKGVIEEDIEEFFKKHADVLM